MYFTLFQMSLSGVHFVNFAYTLYVKKLWILICKYFDIYLKELSKMLLYVLYFVPNEFIWRTLCKLRIHFVCKEIVDFNM